MRCQVRVRRYNIALPLCFAHEILLHPHPPLSLATPPAQVPTLPAHRPLPSPTADPQRWSRGPPAASHPHWWHGGAAAAGRPKWPHGPPPAALCGGAPLVSCRPHGPQLRPVRARCRSLGGAGAPIPAGGRANGCLRPPARSPGRRADALQLLLYRRHLADQALAGEGERWGGWGGRWRAEAAGGRTSRRAHERSRPLTPAGCWRTSAAGC